MLAAVTFTPIAHIDSCYPERFGIPRQAGLVTSAYADIVFDATENNRLALRGIEEFSHLWVLFIFHGQCYRDFKPLVRPPRLGGNKSVGVYATRSPNRPNSIGISAVKLLGVSEHERTLRLNVQGGDFLDGTPVVDVKPYLPYADAIATAQSAWATDPEEEMPVRWSDAAAMVLASLTETENLRCLIEETLSQDPRPGYERNKDGRAGQHWTMRIARYSVRWKVEDGIVEVIQLKPVGDDSLT